MQRQLLLLRHAKSDWSQDELSDHQRPLKQRGVQDAQSLGFWMRAEGWMPQQVIMSDALRARQTWDALDNTLRSGIRPATEPLLYMGGVEELRRCAGFVDPGAQRVLLIGHNPGWEEIVLWLTHQHFRFTTTGLAVLEGAGRDWAEALNERWSLRLGLERSLLPPKP